MAAQGNAPWTVVIVAEDRTLNRTYEFSPEASLSEVMNTWLEGCGQSGYWMFTSADRQDSYPVGFTLEMVGETVLNSGIVTLRVKPQDELHVEPRPTSEIFGHVNDECHYIEVEPELRLYEVLRCLPGRPRELEHNGALLNLEETVDEAGLKNNDVVQECRRQISVSVKLSNGETMIFQVAENSFVLHLVEKVKKYETEDFSLVHQGRHLHMQDRVRDLKQVVEVSMAQFHVDIYGQRVSWTTRSEPITYPQFISQLSFHGEFGNEELERLEYYCTGCRRCIAKSEDVQLLPIECCREKSLTLIATPQSNSKTLEDTQAVLTSLQYFLENIRRRNETKLNTDVPRALCRDLHERLEESGLIYNANIEFVEKVKKDIARRENEINKIQKEIESLKANNATFEEESKTLRAKNTEMEVANIDFKKTVQSFQKVVRCLHENTGVNLFVFFRPEEFSPVASRPEIQQQGRYRWTASPHIKCVVPDLHPGWATFEAVRDVLQPLFPEVIPLIGQYHSEVKGKDVARVTCRADDEVSEDLSQDEYCDEDGRQVTWKEAAKRRQWQVIRERGRVLICGGQRRTVLHIWHS